MRVQIILTDDEANTFEGVATLTQVKSSATPPRKVRTTPTPINAKVDVNFSLPIRAFVKKHGRAMSGAQRFTLLVAYMTGGSENKQILLTDIQKRWSKMTGLLGGEFNTAHSVRAKDQGWVDSPERGAYVILPSWRGIFDA